MSMKVIWFIRIFLIALFAGLVWFFFFSQWSSCNKPDVPLTPLTVINPALQGTFEAEQHTDTIKIPFYKKIYVKEVVPEYIQVVKVDSAFRVIIKNWDVMTKVDKQGRILKIYTYNENDSLLKYSEYEVANDFTATSADHRIVVRYNLWGYNRPSLTAEYSNNAAWDNQRLYLGAETGFNFNERLYLNVNPKYNVFGKGSFIQNLDLSAKLNFKF